MKIGFSPTPHTDQWAILNDIRGGNPWYSPNWLWSQHNEHRVPWLRLAVYADLDWLGGHGYLLYALTFVTLAAQWLLWSIFIKVAALPTAMSLSIVGFFGFCVFCPSQHQNFFDPIQWTFVAAFFFASAAFIAQAWFASRGQLWRALAMASGAAFLSEGSLANGILVWPLLWLAGLALPFRRRHRLVLGAIGTAAIALYLYGYRQPLYHSNPIESIQEPSSLARYIRHYMDHCLSVYFVQAGFAGIVLSLAAFAALVLLARRPNTHAVAVVLSAAMCFVLGTAAMTGLGRLKFGVAQAENSRYQNPVMLYWACVFAALLIGAWQLGSWRDVLTLQVAALAAMLLPLHDLKPLAESIRAQADVASLDGESLDEGVFDPLTDPDLAIRMPIVVPITRYLHARGVAIGPSPPHLPSSIVLSSSDRGGCVGELESVTPLQRFDSGVPEVRLDGWAMNTRTKHPVEAIAIVDEHGNVLGASSLHFERQDVRDKEKQARGRVGWHVYVPLSNQQNKLRAVAIVDGHGCPIGDAAAGTEADKERRLTETR